MSFGSYKRMLPYSLTQLIVHIIMQTIILALVFDTFSVDLYTLFSPIANQFASKKYGIGCSRFHSVCLKNL